MTNRHTVIPRTLCFVFHQDQVLLIKGNPEKEWAGLYNALGGHIEKGESVISSAIREIKEESELDVTDTKLRGIVHVANFFGKDVIMFVTTSKATSLKTQKNREGILKWFKIPEIEQLHTFEDLKPILQQTLSLQPGEIFVGTSQYDGQDKLLSLDIKIN